MNIFFARIVVPVLVLGSFFVSTPVAFAATTSNITTGAITDLTPDTATQATSEITVFSFEFTTGATAGEKFKSVKVRWTGSSASPNDEVDNVYLYQESGTVAGSSFSSGSDTLVDTAAAGAGTEINLDPATDIDLSTNTTYKFYVVADVRTNATVGETVDFKVEADKITFNTGTWPSAADVTANGWNPAGATTVTSSLTTDEMAQVGPASASPGASNVQVLSFTLSNTDTTNKFKSVKVRWTGTASSPNTDIGNVYLYQESGTISGSSFDSGSDTLEATTAAGAGTEITLNPTDFNFTQAKFYVVVDIKPGATLGNLIDFKIETNKIDLTNFNWPNATEVGAGTWNPSGSTQIQTSQSITVDTAAPANATYGASFGVAAHSDSALDVAITTSGSCSGSGTNSATVTMSAGTGTCTVHYNQAGDGSYSAAPEVTNSTTADPLALTVSGVGASDKTYDGGTVATLDTSGALLVGVINADDVTLDTTGAVGAFDDKNVGADKNVTVSGLALTGTTAGNYSLTQPTATADITERNLTVTPTGINKVYDGTIAATVTLDTDKISGDDVTAHYTGAEFADPNVGTDIGVHVTGITIDGTDSLNYNLLADFADTVADITPESTTLSLVGGSLTVDYGTDPALVFEGNPAVSGVDVTYDGSDTVPTDVGSYDVVAASTDPNYAGTFNGTLTINPVTLTVTPADQTKHVGTIFTAFTGTVDGIKYADDITADYSSAGAAADAPLGDYSITATLNDPGSKLTNYTVVSNEGTLHVTNTTPVSADVSTTTTANTPISIVLTATDGDTDALVFATTSNPSHGTLGAITGNLVTYTPSGDYVGPDSFTFTAGDGYATSSDATVTITVLEGSAPETTESPAPAPSNGNGPPVGLFGTTNSILPSAPQTTNGEVLGAETFNFQNNLGYGSRGDDVIELQRILIAYGYLKIAAPTGWFGPLTQAAVKEYQKAHGIVQTGFVGPLTRAALNADPNN